MKLLLASLIITSMSLVPASQAQVLPNGQGKDAVMKICGDCHDFNVIVGMQQTKAGWTNTVDQMVSRGATGSDEELNLVVEYLTRFFGKSDSTNAININSANSKDIEASLELTSRDADIIVEYRHKNGNFKDWQDLAKVDGLDIKKLEAKRDRITF